MKNTIVLLGLWMTFASSSPSALADAARCMLREDQTAICIGDRVIDHRNATGMIQDMYANATAVVRYDHGDVNMMDIQYLSRQVQCLHGYCISDQVIDPDGDVGYIQDLFENGEADVKYSNGEMFWYTLDHLQPTTLPPVVVTYPWPGPRPFPEIVIYTPWRFGFPPGAYPYPWPLGYPYAFPGFGVRVIIHYHPHAPYYVGRHAHEPYRFPRTTTYPQHSPVGHRGPGPVQVPHPRSGGGHGPTPTGPTRTSPRPMPGPRPGPRPTPGRGGGRGGRHFVETVVTQK